MANAPALGARLQSLRPITAARTKSSAHLWAIGATVMVILLMAITFDSQKKVLVAGCGTALIIVLIRSFVQVQRTEQLPRPVKRASWFILLVLACVLSIMYNKLVLASRTAEHHLPQALLKARVVHA